MAPPLPSANCPSLGDEQRLPIVELFERPEGFVCELPVDDTQLLFLRRGALMFSYGPYVDRSLEAGEVLLLPARFRCTMKMEEDVSAVIIRVQSRLSFCDHFPLEVLYSLSQTTGIAADLFFLPINERLEAYLHLLVLTLNEGAASNDFLELKQREMLFYLRAYYSKEDLVSFFSPILNSNIRFSEMAHRHVEKVRSVEEMAERMNYSISGLKKQFVKVFGMSAYQWMAQEKAKKIYYEINCTEKTFKEISAAYRFSSPSHFDCFCKKTFGASPGAIRKERQSSLRTRRHADDADFKDLRRSINNPD
jgi:AraC-like DNA-binding protein